MQIFRFLFLSLACLVLTIGMMKLTRGDEGGEQDRAVKIARYLESNPLAEDSKELRKWALTWFIDHPELDFSVCTEFLAPLLKSQHPYSSEINLQMVLSSGAFVIENPEKMHDKPEVYLAGLGGSLRVYQALLAADPKAKWRFLDGLVKIGEKGKLPGYIEAKSRSCR